MNIKTIRNRYPKNANKKYCVIFEGITSGYFFTEKFGHRVLGWGDTPKEAFKNLSEIYDKCDYGKKLFKKQKWYFYEGNRKISEKIFMAKVYSKNDIISFLLNPSH